MRVYLATLGCRLNEAETEGWAAEFQSRGAQIADAPANADLMVLNTCAVTAEASRKSRQVARRLQRKNPGAQLVMSGCHATLYRDEASAMVGVDLVVGNTDKSRLVELALRECGGSSSPAAATEPGEFALFRRGRERAFVKVQDGCRYRCTFCIVTLARGEEQSRDSGDIVAEIQRLSAQGVKEAVLTGVHLGGYGRDLGRSLPELVAAILAGSDMPRLRFGSLEPWDLPPDFFDLFADPRLMPHLHLPLQSGSDSVLRRMARRCKTAQYRALVDRARSAVADLNITTDIIVGFPGETENEWADTLAFVDEIGFSHLHVFPYSPRSGTKAATLPNQVDPVVKKQRCRELQVLGQRLKRRFLEGLAGRSFPVLWERQDADREAGDDRYLGYTPNFCKVSVAAIPETALSNRILPARISRLSAGGEVLLGELDGFAGAPPL